MCISLFYTRSSSSGLIVMYPFRSPILLLTFLKHPSAHPCPSSPTSCTLPSLRTLYVLPFSLHPTVFPIIANAQIGNAINSLTAHAWRKRSPGPSCEAGREREGEGEAGRREM